MEKKRRWSEAREGEKQRKVTQRRKDGEKEREMSERESKLG